MQVRIRSTGQNKYLGTLLYSEWIASIHYTSDDGVGAVLVEHRRMEVDATLQMSIVTYY
jgi:hypothetical protein